VSGAGKGKGRLKELVWIGYPKGDVIGVELSNEAGEFASSWKDI